MCPKSERLHYRLGNPGDDVFLRTLAELNDVMRFIGRLRVPVSQTAEKLFLLEKENVPVGWGGFVRSDRFNGDDWELICVIKPSCQNAGLAKEACKAFVSWGFEAFRWQKILACVDSQNEKGLNLAKSLGFRVISCRCPDNNTYVFELNV